MHQRHVRLEVRLLQVFIVGRHLQKHACMLTPAGMKCAIIFLSSCNHLLQGLSTNAVSDAPICIQSVLCRSCAHDLNAVITACMHPALQCAVTHSQRDGVYVHSMSHFTIMLEPGCILHTTKSSWSPTLLPVCHGAYHAPQIATATCQKST